MQSDHLVFIRVFEKFCAYCGDSSSQRESVEQKMRVSRYKMCNWIAQVEVVFGGVFEGCFGYKIILLLNLK